MLTLHESLDDDGPHGLKNLLEMGNVSGTAECADLSRAKSPRVFFSHP